MLHYLNQRAPPHLPAQCRYLQGLLLHQQIHALQHRPPKRSSWCPPRCSQGQHPLGKKIVKNCKWHIKKMNTCRNYAVTIQHVTHSKWSVCHVKSRSFDFYAPCLFLSFFFNFDENCNTAIKKRVLSLF